MILVRVTSIAAVLAQVAYPVVAGRWLPALTGLAVLLFALASLTHAATSRGAGAAVALLAVAAGGSLLVEVIGIRTGVPFGGYRYGRTLGPEVLGVPLVVPLAWTMMAYPCLLLARRLVGSGPAGSGPAGSGSPTAGPIRRVRVAVLGGLALAGWDLFLDPQMVAAGHWTWLHPQPGLPGVDGVPLTDLGGWLVAGTALIWLLDRALPGVRPGSPAGELAPALLLAWTWLGSTLADLAFFDRPAVAGYGFAGLGLTVGPYLLRLYRDRYQDRYRYRYRVAGR